MANKKEDLRKADKDGKITKKEEKELKKSGLSDQRMQNFQNKKEVIGNVGNKFDGKDFKAASDAGFSNNKILKIAASSRKVGAKANNKLTKLNPGIKLPSLDRTDGMLGGTLEPINRMYGGLDRMGTLSKIGDQVKGMGKKYLQWQGTDAKGRPQALGGYKVDKGLRKKNKDSMMIGNSAMNRGTFTAANGTGTLYGRDGSSVLTDKGKMKNAPATWRPGASATGSNSGGGKGGKNKGNKFGMEEFEYETPESTESGVFGGSGTDTFGSPTLRRKKSKAQQSGSYTQGPSRLGTDLQRQSGLNIMRT